MVLPDSHRIARVLWYSGYELGNFSFRLQGYHLLWPNFPECSASLCSLNARPTTPTESLQLVWAPPPSLAATDGISVLIYSPRGTEMFQFPRFIPDTLCIQVPVTGKPAGLPHSDIDGSGLAWQLPVAF